MPNFTYDDITAADSGTYWAYHTYDKYQQAHFEQDHEIERMWQEAEELIEDKRKYPLFYWKDGIV